MAIDRLSELLNNALALGAAVLLLVACSGTGDAPLPAERSGAPQITADTLKEFAGKQFGDFTLHRLDALGEPVDDWSGIEVGLTTAGPRRQFEVALSSAAPR